MLPLVDHHNKPHHPITEVFIANFGAQSQVFSEEFLGCRQAGVHFSMHGSRALYDPKSACFPSRAADKFLAFAVRQNRILRPAQKPGLRSAGRHRALYNPKSDCFAGRAAETFWRLLCAKSAICARRKNPGCAAPAGNALCTIQNQIVFAGRAAETFWRLRCAKSAICARRKSPGCAAPAGAALCITQLSTVLLFPLLILPGVC